MQIHGREKILSHAWIFSTKLMKKLNRTASEIHTHKNDFIVFFLLKTEHKFTTIVQRKQYFAVSIASEIFSVFLLLEHQVHWSRTSTEMEFLHFCFRVLFKCCDLGKSHLLYSTIYRCLYSSAFYSLHTHMHIHRKREKRKQNIRR